MSTWMLSEMLDADSKAKETRFLAVVWHLCLALPPCFVLTKVFTGSFQY